MDAIEIYTKVLEITKDSDFNEVITALNFARQKLETDHYSKQKESCIGYGGGLASASLDAAQYDPELRAAEIVRRVVREELVSAKEPEKEAT